jgi:hypothetical protein
MIDRHHIVYLARPLALGAGQGARPWRLGSAWLSLLCLVSLLSRLPLVRSDAPFAPDLHAGTLLIILIALYFLPFDWGSLLPVLAVVLLARLFLGPSYGQSHLSPAIGIAVPLLLVGLLNAPQLVRAIRVPSRRIPGPSGR